MFIRTTVSITLSLIFLILLISWVSNNPASNLKESIPGMDNRDVTAVNKKEVKIGEFFLQGEGVPSGIRGNFGRFRGDNFDNVVDDIIKIDWNNKAPETLWEIQLGEGYAAPAVFEGKVFILDYDEELKADSLLCLSLDNGGLIWKRSYKVPVKRNHGMSRTVCAVDEKYVVSIGPRCHVMCVDTASGDFLWGLDLVKDFGATEPLWYTGQCPLVDNGIAIIATGGDAILIGVDCKTGNILWQTPNPGQWKMTHSSVIRMNIEGTPTYVYTSTGGVIGVDRNGKQLWKTDRWAHSIVVPSPVYCGDGKIFLTAGYGAGSMMLQIVKQPAGFVAEVIYEYKPDNGLAGEQQTPIFYKGRLYGINPDDGGVYKNQLVCSDINGKILWGSGIDNRFGLEPYIIIGDKILLLTETGDLYAAEATDKEFKIAGHMKIFDGIEAWAPLCYAGGLLLARDSKRLVCLKIK